MVVCKFFQQGNCRYGNNCRFEHVRANDQSSNRFGALSGGGGGGRTQGGRDDPLAKYTLSAEMIEKDLRDDCPHWILSSYGPGRDAPDQLFGGFPREQSFEEMRLYYYEAKAKGTEQQALSEAEALYNNAAKQIETARSNSKQAATYILEGEGRHPNRLDICAQGTQGAPFGEFLVGKRPKSLVPGARQDNPFSTVSTPAQPANAFGQPSTLGQRPNPFGQPQASPFGQAAQPTASPSPFGQPQPSAFGQPAQPATQGSTFGQPSQPGAQGGAFGQPSALGAKPNPFGTPTFGQSAQPATQGSTFGQPSQPGSQGSAFGQPSQLGAQGNPFGQPSQLGAQGNAFGQPSQLGQKPNPFSSAASASPSPFGGNANNTAADNTAKPNPFASNNNNPAASNPFAGASSSQPNAFASTANNRSSATPNPFGNPTSSPSPFAQATPAPNNPFAATNQQPTPEASNPFAQKQQPEQQQPANGAFGNQSGGNAFAQNNASPFGQPATPATANPFGAPQTQQPQQAAQQQQNPNAGAAGSPYPPNSTRQHPPVQSYIEKGMDGRVLRFKGKQVTYKEGRPGVKEFNGAWNRIMFPDGPPPYYKDTELRPEEYDDKSKGQWAAFMQTSTFQGGLMPELPPPREVTQWDF